MSNYTPYDPYIEPRKHSDAHLKTFVVVQSPTGDCALTNLVYIAPGEFNQDVEHVMVDKHFAFTIKTDRRMRQGEIGINGPHRRWAMFSNNQSVTVEPYNIHSIKGGNCYLGSLKMEIDFYKLSTKSTSEFKEEDLIEDFTRKFCNIIFTNGQQFAFSFNDVTIAAIVTELQVVDKSALRKGEVDARSERRPDATCGILLKDTKVEFTKRDGSNLNLKESKEKRMKAKKLIKPEFKFEDLGIGGLDDEFNAIFRRAFASRIFPPALVEKLGVQHVKGILLYGPPGTGKTLMARQIGKMLNSKEPKIVSGPEVLSKFVGQSEENVRKLFADAEKEYKEKGEESGLHIVIFDELDAICKSRGTRSGDTGVGDSVVNQLLAKMDGVEQLNNILIIGMTNRKDMIDDALLRPGRLEVHMEIGLPDEQGRLQILKIHTTQMKANDVLEGDVDLEMLADLTKNYSGAEISGVVKAASSYAFSRHIKVGTMADLSTDMEDMKICMDDFMNALKEVQPAFGVSETELKQCVQNGIISFNETVSQVIKDGKLYVDQVRQSSRTPLVSVLLHGLPGAGKTALAATIAMNSVFPFIKLISPENMVGMTESQKVTEINKVFNDSYKSPLSVIVVDAIERLLDYVPIGPRFSNSVLQTLLVLLKKKPPKGRRLLILATTTQRSILDHMDMTNEFSAEIVAPAVTEFSGLSRVLSDLDLFTEEERSRVIDNLKYKNQGKKLNIGIKKLLMIIEMARQDKDMAGKFVSSLSAFGFVDGTQVDDKFNLVEYGV